MAHFAKVLNNIVQQVMVAEPEFMETFTDSSPGEWIQTSYNTHGGVHSDGGTPLRKNYASIGDTYDTDRDAFIAPKPYTSWTLNETTCYWEAPVARPDSDTPHHWDEDSLTWIEDSE